MISESPLKIRDDIQQLNKAPMPKKNGNGDSSTKLKMKKLMNPIQPIQRKIFPAKVNDSEILSLFVTGDNSLSSSKRFSNPELSVIFLILY